MHNFHFVTGGTFRLAVAAKKILSKALTITVHPMHHWATIFTDKAQDLPQTVVQRLRNGGRTRRIPTPRLVTTLRSKCTRALKFVAAALLLACAFREQEPFSWGRRRRRSRTGRRVEQKWTRAKLGVWCLNRCWGGEPLGQRCSVATLIGSPRGREEITRNAALRDAAPPRTMIDVGVVTDN